MEQQAPKKKKRIYKVLLIILSIFIVLRLCLPFVVLHFVNKKLAAIPGYYGHVEDIDIALYRGAYVMDSIFLVKVDSVTKEQTPFFTSSEIDLSVEWNAIFHGKIVAELEFKHPVLEFTMDKTIGKKAPEDTTDFIQLVKDFAPLKINRFAISDGEVHYVDKGEKPPVDVVLNKIFLEAKGFTNEAEEGILLPASINLKARLYDGNLAIDVKLDPLNKFPTFDMNAQMTQTNLVHLNPFFEAYGNFKLNKGSLSVYSEFAAKNNAFKGYIKPLVKDIDVVQKGSVGEILWGSVVGSIAEIFQNQTKDQLATKVPLEGKFTQPDVKVFDAILALLKNAFIQALNPHIEKSINISAVGNKPQKKKGFFKRLFEKDEK